MIRGINKVIIVGRLGADPDLRFAPNGTAIARFNVATTERVPVGEGNWDDRTEWHRVVVFGRLAEMCGNYLSKGRLVYVEGRLRTQQWEDKQGTKRFTTEIIARDIQFLDSTGPTKENMPESANIKETSVQNDSLSESLAAVPEGNIPDDDIPF